MLFLGWAVWGWLQSWGYSNPKGTLKEKADTAVFLLDKMWHCSCWALACFAWIIHKILCTVSTESHLLCLWLCEGLQDGDVCWAGVRQSAALPGDDREGIPAVPLLRRQLPAIHQQFQEQGRLLPNVSQHKCFACRSICTREEETLW